MSVAEKLARIDDADYLAALRLWIVSDVARARGLAQSIAELPEEHRVDGVRANAAEIMRLLDVDVRVARWSK